jgi:hypothetical protein
MVPMMFVRPTCGAAYERDRRAHKHITAGLAEAFQIGAMRADAMPADLSACADALAAMLAALERAFGRRRCTTKTSYSN